MRIQLASDLHLEFLLRDHPARRVVELGEGVDVLVLAGDIATGVAAVEAFADWPVEHVLYVAGNHEFYGHRWESTADDIRATARGTKVHFLDNEAVELSGVRFLGTTLWTDFELDGAGRSLAMARVENTLMDYCSIRKGGGRLRAADTLHAHQVARAWLQQELDLPFPGKTVVVSHHGPHPLSVHPRYVGNPVNPGFVSDLTPMLCKADLWLHGHVHDSFDYTLGRCRVVANPAGYVKNRQWLRNGMRLELENQGFNAQLTIDL